MQFDGISLAGGAAPFPDPRVHTAAQRRYNFRFLVREIAQLLRILDQVVELHRRFAMKIRFQRLPELPDGRPPPVLAHPRTLCDVELRPRRAAGVLNIAFERNSVELDAPGQALLPRDVQQRRHEVLLKRHRLAAHARLDHTRPVKDQRHHQRRLVQPVMIEPAFVVVQRLAVVARDDDQAVVRDPQFLGARHEPLNARIHIRQRPVVLGNNELRVPDARRQPRQQVVRERFERPDGIHSIRQFPAARILRIEQRIVRRRGIVGRVGVHVPEIQQPRLVRLMQPFQLGQNNRIQVLRLARGTLRPRPAPAFVLQVLVKAPVPLAMPHHDRPVSRRLQQLRQCRLVVCHGAQGRQGHLLVGDDVPAGQHGHVGRRRGDVRAERVLKHRTPRREAVHVRRGQPRIPVTAHVVAANAVNREYQQVRRTFRHSSSFPGG